MAFLTGFNITLDELELLGEGALAAFAGKPVPAGWTVLKPVTLGLGAQYRDGDYYTDGNSGATAIVLQQGNEFIVAFRGSDGSNDIQRYPELFDGSYIDHFKPLLDALKAQAPAGAHFSFTGASLGGGATNQMAAIAANSYGGYFDDSTFVAFAAPNISNANGILNIGLENDPIYKAVPASLSGKAYADYASSVDNLVLATDEYVAGNYDGRHPFSVDAHSATEAFDAFNRIENSEFYSLMTPDAPIIIADSDGLVTDMNPSRSTTGAFYLGRATADRISGQDGDDYIEGFDGNDILNGHAGNDKIDGGNGNDIMNGAKGTDIFIYHASGGADVVTDFTASGDFDKLTFVDMPAIATFADAMAKASQVGGNVVFDFGGGDTLTLNNVALGTLTAANFAFGFIHGPNQAPTNISLANTDVSENVLGAVVGALTVTDSDLDTAFTFTMSDSRFKVIGGLGAYQLALRPGAFLDFESEQAVGLDITAKDAGGLSVQVHFDIHTLDSATGLVIAGTTGNDTIDATHGPDNQGHATNENDTINGNAGDDIISGLDGNDKINGGLGKDVISGDAGDDTLNGNAGADQIDGGTGADTILVSGKDAQFDTLNGGGDTDTLQVTGAASATLSGFDAAAQSIEAWVGNGKAVLGDSGNNVFDLSGLAAVSGIAYLDAGNGNDTLTGSAFADVLRGGNGNDVITGVAGNDTLTGGKNADTFIFGANFGHDTITDFAAGTLAGHDVIQIDHNLLGDFGAVQAAAQQNGTSLVITVDANDTITLQAMTLAKLVADDFLFV